MRVAATATAAFSAAELARNTILGGERVLSASLSAQLSSGSQKCSWTGTAVAGGAPQISIPVSMSTSGAVPGETDTTIAHGTITIG